jgi:hypothetical protein
LSIKRSILLLLQHGNTRHIERRRDGDSDADNDAIAGERDDLAADSLQTGQEEREHQQPLLGDLLQTDPAEDLDDGVQGEDNSRNNNNNNGGERNNETMINIKKIESEIKGAARALSSTIYFKNYTTAYYFVFDRVLSYSSAHFLSLSLRFQESMPDPKAEDIDWTYTWRTPNRLKTHLEPTIFKLNDTTNPGQTVSVGIMNPLQLIQNLLDANISAPGNVIFRITC